MNTMKNNLEQQEKSELIFVLYCCWGIICCWI
jgi:hypothetical protein